MTKEAHSQQLGITDYCAGYASVFNLEYKSALLPLRSSAHLLVSLICSGADGIT